MLLDRLDKPEEAAAAFDNAIHSLLQQNAPRHWLEIDNLRFMKIGVLRRCQKFEAARQVQNEIFVISPREESLSARLRDLTSVYTAGLNHDWHGTVGANSSSLPPGQRVLGGIPFDIRGVIQLRSALMLSHLGARPFQGD